MSDTIVVTEIKYTWKVTHFPLLYASCWGGGGGRGGVGLGREAPSHKSFQLVPKFKMRHMVSINF